MLEALVSQLLCDFFLQFQLRLQIAGRRDLRRRGRFPFQPYARRVVLQLSFVADNGAIHAGRFQAATGIDHEFNHDA